MKITLKKGSVGAAPGMVSESVAPSSETPVDLSAAPVASELPPALAESLGSSPVSAGSQRKGVNIFGIVFAVIGFLAIAVFLTALILQGQEFSFYKASESLWLK